MKLAVAKLRYQRMIVSGVTGEARSVRVEQRTTECLPNLHKPLPLTRRVARPSVPELLAQGLVLRLEMHDHSLLLARDPADSQEKGVMDGMKHATGVAVPGSSRLTKRIGRFAMGIDASYKASHGHPRR